MIDPQSVSAVLVTRGNVDLSEIVESIGDAGIEDIVVWNNAERENLSCYGRYAGIAEARNPWIYHQDDDLVAPVADLLRCVDPERDRHVVVANNRADEDWPLTAMGAVFHRDLAETCFDEYVAAYGWGPEFFRVCDVVFAYENAHRRVALPYRDLPWASDPASSMYLESGHMDAREVARARTLTLAGLVAA